MTNLARFTISGTPSSNRRFDVSPEQTPVLQLEQTSTLVWRVTYEVHSAALGSPRATKNSPLLTLSNGSIAGASIDAITQDDSVTISGGIPEERAAHLWEIRCKVNGGNNEDGSPNPDFVFSRYMAMRSPQGLRKLLGTERDEYDPIDSWAGAINELIDLWSTSGGSVDPTKLPLNGLRHMEANLPFGDHKGIDLADPEDPTDAVNLRTLVGYVEQNSFAINSWGTSQSLLVERGTTVSGLSGSAAYSYQPNAASVAGSLGGSVGGDSNTLVWGAMSTPFTSASATGSITRGGTDLGADPTYTATLTATLGNKTLTADWVIYWGSLQYFGVGPAVLNSSADVQALSGKQLAPDIVAPFTLSPSAQYVWYCQPKGMAPVNIWAGGILAAVNDPIEIAVTRNGVTRTYRCYRLTYPVTIPPPSTSITFSLVKA